MFVCMMLIRTCNDVVHDIYGTRFYVSAVRTKRRIIATYIGRDKEKQRGI